MKKAVSVLMALVMILSVTFGLSFNASATEISPVSYMAQVKGETQSEIVPEVTLTQTTVNYLDQTISIANIDEVVASGISSVKITANMSYNNVVTQTKSEVITLEVGKSIYSFAYPTYGKFTTTLEFMSSDVVVCTLESVIGIIAEEYNIATLNASFPVIYFTLDIQDKAFNENGEPVPTFVALERDDAYNWDALSDNVYGLPYATYDELHNGRENYFLLRDIMATFVKDLYELCPQSCFNLYTVDNYCENILITLTANRIPDSQYKVYILSDGSGSYAIFNKTFSAEDSVSIYNEMAAEWARLKTQVYEEQKFDGSMVEKYIGQYGEICQILENYPYVIAKEENNVEWWLARVNDTLQSPDADFLASVKEQSTLEDGCIKIKAMNTMLTDLQSKGDVAVNKFKGMYKFNDSMFTEAVNTGKKVMMILGTRVTGEVDFTDYAKFVMAYYGDDYIYYYKGHPATPTGLYPEKQEQLNSLNITDVESSIAAELIMFFYPDIYLCGYRSSTFLSVADPKMACALFNTTKGTNTDAYGPTMDSFVSRIDIENEYYEAYKNYCIDENAAYYLIEYNDTSNCAFSIYNATSGVLTDFKSDVNAVYNYSIVDNGTTLNSGSSTTVTLPILESTANNNFVGWTDGTYTYGGGITVVLKNNTTFSSVWSKVNNVGVTTDVSSNINTTAPTATVQSNAVQTAVVTEYVDTVKAKTPKKSAVKKLKKGKKAFKVTLKKVNNISGYQVQYATDKKFTKNKKTVNVKKSKTSTVVKKLKSKKKYYVRVRTYKTTKINGTYVKIYSGWSTVKSVTTK